MAEVPPELAELVEHNIRQQRLAGCECEPTAFEGGILDGMHCIWFQHENHCGYGRLRAAKYN